MSSDGHDGKSGKLGEVGPVGQVARVGQLVKDGRSWLKIACGRAPNSVLDQS
jgi:hypothetical protein